MTAAENDSLRQSILQHFYFGRSAAPPTGSLLAVSGSVSALGRTVRQALMEAVLHVDTFDDSEHTASTFQFRAQTASFALIDNTDGATRTLAVGIQ